MRDVLNHLGRGLRMVRAGKDPSHATALSAMALCRFLADEWGSSELEHKPLPGQTPVAAPLVGSLGRGPTFRWPGQ